MLELDLAELARERQAHVEAEGRYTRALQRLAAGDDARRLIAHRGRALVRSCSGRAEEALADFAAARAAAQRLADEEAEAEVLLAHATALDWLNQAAAAAALVEAAAALAASAGVRSRALHAGLLMGRGRAHFRAGRCAEAWDLLQQAVVAAERLGGAGYEPLVVSLILLEVVLPYLGRTPEAEAAAGRAIGLARAKGDLLNLGSAINNRRNLLVARRDLQAAIEDQRAFREIGRQLGLALPEYFAEFNLGELYYQAGDVGAAGPCAERAAGFEARMPSIAPRPSALLLQARICTFRGLLVEARALLARVTAAVAQARAEDRIAGLLSPSEEVLATMVDLCTREASAAEWEQLVACSARDSLEQEPIELLEMRARADLRGGRTAEAQRRFGEALALASRVPNLFEPRIRRALSAQAPAN